ncbi:MAG: Fic family protein [Clostridia bacterium]|nr:Fic family protein [Clostridia bacterium]
MVETSEDLHKDIDLTNESLITELAFQLVLDSEESEDFGFDLHYINTQHAPSVTHINKEVILEFLESPETRVFVRMNPKTEQPQLVATNLISKESVIIEGLAGHYLTLLEVVDKAEKLRDSLKKGKTKKPLLSHEFIQKINLSIQPRKAGEAGIGEYRRLDFLGNPIKVCIGRNVDGKLVPVKSLQLVDGLDVEKEMKKLIDWVNSDKFAEMCDKDIYIAIAEFHARYIKIHPFRDGNGRTARLLTNYLLLSQGKQIVTIPIEDKEEYNNALNFANVTTLKEGADELDKLDKYIMEKYSKLPKKALIDYITKGTKSQSVSRDEIIAQMESYRTENQYKFLGQFFKNHQVPQNAKKVTKQILNDYGRRSIDLFVSQGTPKASLSPSFIQEEDLTID